MSIMVYMKELHPYKLVVKLSENIHVHNGFYKGITSLQIVVKLSENIHVIMVYMKNYI